METNALGWFGIIGTAITTTGTVLVAIISAKNSQRTKTIQRETTETADDNKKEILGAIEDLKGEIASNSRVTVATARSQISQVYTENKDKKQISEKSWRNVCELHEAYKSVKIDGHTPNSWCDQIVEEMSHWEKI